MSASWRGWLLPEAATDPAIANTAPPFESWLRTASANGLPFDQLATELLTYPLNGRQASPRIADAGETDTGAGALAFYNAKEGKLRTGGGDGAAISGCAPRMCSVSESTARKAAHVSRNPPPLVVQSARKTRPGPKTDRGSTCQRGDWH